MPQNKFALARYRLIDTLLRRRSRVKTAEMARFCRHETGFSVSQRTIQLDLEAMQHDPFLGFFAPIAYDSACRAYYYTDPSYSLARPPLRPEEAELLRTLRQRFADLLSPRESALLEKLIERWAGEAK